MIETGMVDRMDIVYSSSDSYCEVAGISILSLCETNRCVDEITIYMIDNHISQENKDRLTAIAAQYRRALVFLSPPDLEALCHININVFQWNISTFYRLILPYLLPQSVTRVLYIDCDTLVCAPLADMWAMDLQGCCIAAVDDLRHPCFRAEIGLRSTDVYVNCGNLVIDLERWRAENISRQMIDRLVAAKGNMPFVDQGVLNAVLACQQKILVMPPKYNAMTLLFTLDYDSIIRLRRPAKPYMTRSDYDEAVRQPAIVHFTPLFILGNRPWHMGYNRHPYAKAYDTYKAQSPWRDVPYQQDPRGAKAMAVVRICSLIPRRLLTGIVGTIYGVYYPLKKRRKSRWQAIA